MNFPKDKIGASGLNLLKGYTHLYGTDYFEDGLPSVKGVYRRPDAAIEALIKSIASNSGGNSLEASISADPLINPFQKNWAIGELTQRLPITQFNQSLSSLFWKIHLGKSIRVSYVIN